MTKETFSAVETLALIDHERMCLVNRMLANGTHERNALERIDLLNKYYRVILEILSSTVDE